MFYCVAKALENGNYSIRRYRSFEAMQTFLNSQFDDEWQPIKASVKSGEYVKRDNGEFIPAK